MGSLSAPQSALDLGDNGSVELELSEQVYLTKLMYFSNLGTGSYNLEVSADGETWYTLWARKDEEGDVTGYYWADAEGYSPSYALPQKYNDLFKWLEIEPENPQNVRYLRLTGKADKGLLELGELALYSAVGESRDPLGRLNVSPAPLSARNGTDLTFLTSRTPFRRSPLGTIPPTLMRSITPAPLWSIWRAFIPTRSPIRLWASSSSVWGSASLA